MHGRRVYVAVIGPGTGAGTEELAAARKAGRLLAEAGAVVLTGGHGGVMAAAAAGAGAAGGLSIGLLPGLDRGEADPVHGLTIPTGLGELRNGLLVRAAEAIVCIGGSWGTLSEIALAVRTGRPVFAVGGWTLPAAGVRECAEVTEAVRLALEAVRP